jgi:hypothetical protein
MEPNQIRLIPGQPLLFVATKKFALGSTGVDVLEGMELLFDGSTVEVNGMRYTMPTLRGSLKLGWLVLAEDYDPDAVEAPRVSANIQVRAAVNTSSNPMAPPQRAPITTAESDERIVMTRGQRTEASNQTTQAARQQHIQRQAGGVARQTGKAEIEIGGAEFGVPVSRQFKTAANARTEVTPNSVGQAIIAADKIKIDPGEGLSEEQMLAAMTDEQRDAYLAKKEAAKANVTSRLNPKWNGPPVSQVQSTQPKTVGRVRTARTQTTEGVTATVTSGGGTEVYDPTGMGGQTQQTVVEHEGIRFTNTNTQAPKRAAVPPPPLTSQLPTEESTTSKIEKDGTADQRRKIAKTLCPDFPDNYNFSDHWKRRLAMIRLNYEGRADVIRAIFAAESDDFKKVLMEEFPEVFSS